MFDNRGFCMTNIQRMKVLPMDKVTTDKDISGSKPFQSRGMTRYYPVHLGQSRQDSENLSKVLDN
jgi:hypothetical protein